MLNNLYELIQYLSNHVVHEYKIISTTTKTDEYFSNLSLTCWKAEEFMNNNDCRTFLLVKMQKNLKIDRAIFVKYCELVTISEK